MDSRRTSLTLTQFPSKASETAKASELVSADYHPAERDWRFWCIIFSLSTCMLLTALEFSSIGTALPQIVKDIGGGEFVWVGSSYTLGSAALLPFSGGLAQIFGRRATMIGSIAIFALGSALCGAAKDMNFLIAARTIQGLGGGAITALIQIILADLVSLRERGVFNGIIALAWAIGGGIGPVLGGSLAQAGQWRWLFYLNLPICVVSAAMIAIFLKTQTPCFVTLKEKIAHLDIVGNIIFTASSTSVVIALSWGGLKYDWSSPQVLISLVAGLIGFCIFLAYEAVVATHPVIPLKIILVDRTTFSGYMQCFLMGVILACLVYWGPLYFQACKDASPIQSGIDIFGLSYSVSPFAVVAGGVVMKTGRFRPPIWIAWVLIIVGLSLYTTLEPDTPVAHAIGFEIIAGAGIGAIYVATQFPVLAPIPVNMAPSALVFFTFLRNFAFVWGVTLGGAILQNELKRRLPADLLANVGGSEEIALAVIEVIPTLSEELKVATRAAYADSLRIVWISLVAIASAGVLVSGLMKYFPLHTQANHSLGPEVGSLPANDTESALA
ncbi:MFS multidrug transporter [Peniophora sp. CONT]|nr:MFS multidrug transporter [Peniophora sp. CONT]